MALVTYGWVERDLPTAVPFPQPVGHASWGMSVAEVEARYPGGLRQGEHTRIHVSQIALGQSNQIDLAIILADVSTELSESSHDHNAQVCS